MGEFATGKHPLVDLIPHSGEYVKPLAAYQGGARDAGEENDHQCGAQPDAVLNSGEDHEFDHRHSDEDEGKAHARQDTAAGML